MKTLFEITTLSTSDTISEAKSLMSKLPKESKLFFLNGEIGAGKTTFVKGIAKHLGIDDDITSPTYGYKKEYEGLVHYDLFLSKKMKKKEIEFLISEDLENNLVFVEWGNKVPKIKGSIIIDLKVKDEEKRNITVSLID